ncbi:MAG: PrsW family intramembrane metalloprotease [Solobacterium sp.]|nr:PrsW family intramembrane metalloprotease [Solobacterium sp.]
MIPFVSLDMFYIAAAVLPAAVLMVLTYRLDRAEPEPSSLLAKMVLMGCVAVIPAIVLEIGVQDFLLPLFSYDNYTQYYIILALTVGLIEEGCKFFFLYRSTWNDPNFNYVFDGVIYAVYVSLGFAALENIEYVFQYGLSVALTRAFLAVPGHFAFSVFMGAWYGSAKVQEVRGNHGAKITRMILAYLSAVAVHTMYDALAMIGTDRATILFFLFVMVMYVVVYRKVKAESAGDRFIY